MEESKVINKESHQLYIEEISRENKRLQARHAISLKATKEEMTKPTWDDTDDRELLIKIPFNWKIKIDQDEKQDKTLKQCNKWQQQ